MIASDRHAITPLKKQWGILGGTIWVFIAFFLPQFAVMPFVEFLNTIPADRNTKQFILQGIVELLSVLFIWLIIKYLYGARLTSIGLGKTGSSILLAVFAFPVYIVASTIVTNILGVIFSINLQQAQEIGYSNPSGFGLVLIFVALVLLAPFVEEVLFRGFLFTAFRRTFGFWVGAAIVSLLFAVAHGQANVGIDVFVLSMFLCYLREKTDSLWPSVALHALKNLVAFIALFIIGVK